MVNSSAALDATFAALADPTRRALFERLCRERLDAIERRLPPLIFRTGG